MDDSCVNVIIGLSSCLFFAILFLCALLYENGRYSGIIDTLRAAKEEKNNGPIQ
jgi:hypothetical protein